MTSCTRFEMPSHLLMILKTFGCLQLIQKLLLREKKAIHIFSFEGYLFWDSKQNKKCGNLDNSRGKVAAHSLCISLERCELGYCCSRTLCHMQQYCRRHVLQYARITGRSDPKLHASKMHPAARNNANCYVRVVNTGRVAE